MLEAPHRPLTNQHLECIMANENLTTEQLRELFHYDPSTGKLTRKSGPWKDTPVGNLSAVGYITVSVRNSRFYAHRIAWAIHHGEWPVLIDHINGNRSDNRIENLRNVTQYENMQNRHRPTKRSSSGILGVTAVGSKWHMHIMSRGESFTSIHDSKEDAQQAYLTAKRLLHSTGR